VFNFVNHLRQADCGAELINATFVGASNATLLAEPSPLSWGQVVVVAITHMHTGLLLSLYFCKAISKILFFQKSFLFSFAFSWFPSF